MRRPSPGKLGERLRGARFLAEDALAALARLPRAVGRGGGAFWSGLSVEARRRLAAALAATAVLVAFFALAAPNLPCGLPGGEQCPPADDAAGLVPADALAYAHASVEPGSEQYERARELAEAAPLLSGQLVARAVALVPGPGGRAPDPQREIEPWLGGEAAFAVLPASGRVAERVELLEIADAEEAARYTERIAAGAPAVESYRGFELSSDRRGLATAQVDGFLVIGSTAGVREVIDTATGAGGATSLAADQAADELRAELPEHRLAEAYLSEEGIARLVAPGQGALGDLAPLLAPGAARGAAMALATGEDGELELSVRSALDPERATAEPGFFAAFPAFEPELVERLEPQTAGYLGIGDPGSTVRALLDQASAQAPGIAAGFEDLADSLRGSGELDIERQLLPALGGEAAFALVPGPSSGGAPAGGAGLPALELLASDVDEERARRALAGLQAPLVEAIDPAEGLQAPVFDQRDVDGVEVNSLRVSPAVELSYAVFDGLAAVASDPAAIESLIRGEGGLDEAERFERATEGFEDEVSLLAYLDLEQVIGQLELLGLSQVAAYNTFAPELRRLQALGVAVREDDSLLATDARLVVDPDAPSGAEPAPVAPSAD